MPWQDSVWGKRPLGWSEVNGIVPAPALEGRCSKERNDSGQYFVNDMSMDIRQASFQAVMPEG